MLGEKQRAEPMFYHVRMADIIPENYLLRLIDRYENRASDHFSETKRKHKPDVGANILLMFQENAKL